MDSERVASAQLSLASQGQAATAKTLAVRSHITKGSCPSGFRGKKVLKRASAFLRQYQISLQDVLDLIKVYPISRRDIPVLFKMCNTSLFE